MCVYWVDLVLCSHSGGAGKGMKAEDIWPPSPFYLHPETRFVGVAARSQSDSQSRHQLQTEKSVASRGTPCAAPTHSTSAPESCWEGTLGRSQLSSLSVGVQERMVDRDGGMPPGPVPVGLTIELKGVEWG